MTILDKDGIPLSTEDECDYQDDLWDMGVPASAEACFEMWLKWGERLGMEKLEGYDEWLEDRKARELLKDLGR